MTISYPMHVSQNFICLLWSIWRWKHMWGLGVHSAPPPLPQMVRGTKEQFDFPSHWTMHHMRLVVVTDYIVSHILNIIIQIFIQNYQPFTIAIEKSNFDNMLLMFTQWSRNGLTTPHLAFVLFVLQMGNYMVLVRQQLYLQNLQYAFLDIPVHSLGMCLGGLEICWSSHIRANK